MLVLNLHWVLFGVLALMLAVAGGTAWLLDRKAHSHRSPWPFPAPARPIFEQAPFGLVLLDRPDTCLYANPYAQRLLGLPALPGSLPAAPWADDILSDNEGLVTVDVQIESAQPTGAAQPQ